jgi:hypothetical protein
VGLRQERYFWPFRAGGGVDVEAFWGWPPASGQLGILRRNTAVPHRTTMCTSSRSKSQKETAGAIVIFLTGSRQSIEILE